MKLVPNIETSVLQQISPEQAYHYRIVPYANKNGAFHLYTDQNSPEALQGELQIVFDKEIVLKTLESKTLQTLLSKYYRSNSQTFHFSQDFLDQILFRAKEIGSSDIHFEPYQNHARIRFRLDGKLIEQFTIPLEEYPVIINKIKIKANLDIAEKRLPQDGRISIKNGPTEFDIRVSSLPILAGEKIVLRILSKDTNEVELSHLGFTDAELKTYLHSVKKPNGILLISGPTGSGKTTTLYATLKQLNQPNTNILTIEDPIEYTLEGVNQVQLKENIGLDFPTALRTFLRQDPDIIMVGEIRDVKTANIAIRAALTGHLVLSTIHTNSAWATVSRLIDMGIPPFLIASTLNLSVAQRLVRKLCSHCKEATPTTAEDFPPNFEIPKTLSQHYLAKGCTQCHQTGYKGRKAIYEIIPIEKSLIPQIKSNALEIDSYLKENHIPNLQDNALRLIQEGITSVAEVYAIIS
ncbi:MAG: GspE/PulE family protein [Flavobacteriaceae bacterium]|nr:GspE/PulE family protein [Flavobacteriaceae bacterium]